ISNQTIGMNENQLAQFNIHPNPVKNELFIELNENQITQINIIDLSGKILLSQKQINGNSIDVSNLSQGVYAIQISTEKGMTTSRFVKK
ncbi:MAG: T9SS type A sorting domain-containing protein, partial [Flavobacteriales bacterium]